MNNYKTKLLEKMVDKLHEPLKSIYNKVILCR